MFQGTRSPWCGRAAARLVTQGVLYAGVALAVAGSAHAADTDALASDPSTTGVYWLFAFMTLFLGAAALVHRRFSLGGGLRGNPELKMVATLSLGDKRAIVMIEAEAERLLVGVTPQNIQLLTRMPAPPDEVPTDLDGSPLGQDGVRLAGAPPRFGESAPDSGEGEVREGVASGTVRFGALLRAALARGKR